MEDEKKLVALVPVIKSDGITTTLNQIYEPLEEFVTYNGLPTENVLASNCEKVKLFSGFSGAIELLPIEKRKDASYLTKFVVSCAVGLFDGALNFLWDEVIRSLREKVTSYDLLYFYSVAEQINSKYKNLSTSEDLECISDFDLLSILKRIDFFDDIAFKTLEYVNYLRNHASAAHPNTNDLSGIKITGLLEDAIKYSIMLEPNSSTIIIKKLFNNIRTTEIPIEDFDVIVNELKKFPTTRIDDFVSSLFGLYCDLRIEEFVQKNILEISKRAWLLISDENKYNIGSKFGFYRKNGDVEQKERVNIFLENVDGLKFKDSDSIVAEMIEQLNQLRSVHYGINNFYNEYPYARDIAKTIPSTGIPSTVKKIFIKTICICYAGNGYGYKEGVDETAVTVYEKFIQNFGNEEIKLFLLLFNDEEFVVDFYKTKPEKRIKQLCNILKLQTTNSDLISGLDVIIKSNNLDKLRLTTDYISIMNKIKSSI